MPTTIPTAHELQEQVLAAVRQGQESALDAIKAVVKAVTAVTPKVASVTVPLADKLPTPEAIAASAHDFAERLLAQQRKFTEEVLKATAPLRHAAGRPAADTPADEAPAEASADEAGE